MRYSSTFTLLLLLLLLFGCTNQADQKETNQVSIDFAQAEDLLLTNLFGNIRFVPLETPDGSLITACDHIIKVSHDKIGILSVHGDRAFYLFDLTGKHLFSVSGMVDGPGSFVGAQDFIFEHKTNHVVICDPMQSKLVVFDGTGILVDERFGVPSLGLELAHIPNDDLLICPKNGPEAEFGLLQVNDDLDTKKELFPIAEWQRILSTIRRYVEGADEGAFYYNWFDDHIYWTDGQAVRTPIHLDFEQGHVGEADKEGLMRSGTQYFADEMLNKPTLYAGRSFHYIDGYLFTVYFYNHSYYLSIIDTHTGQHNLSHLPPDPENFLLLPEISTTYADNCYYLMEVTHLIDNVLPIADRWSDVDFSPLDGLSYSDNPVVAIAEIDKIFIDSILSSSIISP